MRVFFLGTGAAEGFPALFSGLPINREALRRGGKNLRLRAGILIDETIRVDLCPDALAQVHKYPQIDFSALEHLLFTHSHDDHFAVRELQYLSPNFAPDRVEPLQVYATGEIWEKLDAEMAHFYEEAPLVRHKLAPFCELTVGHLTVIPITAHHRQDELCLNFLFREGDRCLLYGSDTGWYDPPTWKFLEGVHLDGVILECGKGISGNNYEGHLSLDECIAFKHQLVASGSLSPEAPFYLTHICHTGLLLHEEMEALCAPHGIHVAYDGLEFVI